MKIQNYKNFLKNIFNSKIELLFYGMVLYVISLFSWLLYASDYYLEISFAIFTLICSSLFYSFSLTIIVFSSLSFIVLSVLLIFQLF